MLCAHYRCVMLCSLQVLLFYVLITGELCVHYRCVKCSLRVCYVVCVMCSLQVCYVVLIIGVLCVHYVFVMC